MPCALLRQLFAIAPTAGLDVQCFSVEFGALKKVELKDDIENVIVSEVLD